MAGVSEAPCKTVWVAERMAPFRRWALMGTAMLEGVGPSVMAAPALRAMGLPNLKFGMDQKELDFYCLMRRLAGAYSLKVRVDRIRLSAFMMAISKACSREIISVTLN